MKLLKKHSINNKSLKVWSKKSDKTLLSSVKWAWNQLSRKKGPQKSQMMTNKSLTLKNLKKEKQIQTLIRNKQVSRSKIVRAK